jgi:hypothetical protein
VDPGAIQFVRIDVLSGASEIDGIVMVVPEPGAGALFVAGFGMLMLVRRMKG